MSSRRFPGKVLAPFRGEPLIAHVIRTASDVVGPEGVTVLTSTDATDDPLVSYVRQLGVDVFRGSLDNVFERFRECSARRQATWIARINADSPLMRPSILKAVVARGDDTCDLVSTIAPRTLPRGQNPELIRASMLLSTDESALTPEDREHVTSYFYRHPERCRVVNLALGSPVLAEMNLSVDDISDLRRLESLPASELDSLFRSSIA